jgi:hypothetical protein
VSENPTPIRCLVCGGRGGWWSGEFREQCQRCKQTGWEPDPQPWLVALVGDLQDYDGFTPEVSR